MTFVIFYRMRDCEIIHNGNRIPTTMRNTAHIICAATPMRNSQLSLRRRHLCAIVRASHKATPMRIIWSLGTRDTYAKWCELRYMRHLYALCELPHNATPMRNNASLEAKATPMRILAASLRSRNTYAHYVSCDARRRNVDRVSRD